MYSQLKNLEFAITPQVEIDLQVEILDEMGETIFDKEYESGRVFAQYKRKRDSGLA